MLQLAGSNTHWIVVWLLNTSYLLEKFDRVFDNQHECLQLSLSSHIEILNNEIPKERDKCEKAVECIVEGSMMCASQLYSRSLFRFSKSSVNFESLSNLKTKLKGLYDDLILTAAIAIIQQLPSLLPLSHPPEQDGAVGIEEPRKEVMRSQSTTMGSQ